MSKRQLKRALACWGCVAAIVGCISVELPAELSLTAQGVSFVVSGTAAVVDSEGPCLVWMGENGRTYHLFQSPGLDNESFDRVTTPGVTSRLEIATRDDLEVACMIGTVVEVQDVLEIVE
ncbi:MAG: hypothetical protein KJ749_10980 [Planctomycetes bacterium]|nr:hypothetical protein [Planctomycetota bacterium]